MITGGPGSGQPVGKPTEGCPMRLHPANITSNRDCTLCTTCVDACGHFSVEFRLRPPAWEIWAAEHSPMRGEWALNAVLLGTPLLHHADVLLAPLGLGEGEISLLPQLMISSVVLALPGATYLALDGVARLVAERKGEPESALRNPKSKNSFVTLSYSCLPLVLAGNLTHWEPFFFKEAGHILPVTLRMFGVSSTASLKIAPHIALSNDVSQFLQVITLLLGLSGSELLAARLTRVAPAPLRTAHMVNAPLITALLGGVIVGPLHFFR